MIWRNIRRDEKDRLLRKIGSETGEPVGVLLGCAIGLLIVLAIALAGNLQRDVATVPSQVDGTPNHRGTASIAESRKVFNERRARYVEAYPESRVALESASPQIAEAHSDGGYQQGQRP